MENIMEKVKEIRIYKKSIITNNHHERDYIIKRYMEIEFFNGKTIKLDIDSGADITNCDYLEVEKNEKRERVLFRSNLLENNKRR